MNNKQEPTWEDYEAAKIRVYEMNEIISRLPENARAAQIRRRDELAAEVDRLYEELTRAPQTNENTGENTTYTIERL